MVFCSYLLLFQVLRYPEYTELPLIRLYNFSGPLLTDLFGIAIKAGENYFRLKPGIDRSDDLKLSFYSMDRFIFALFSPNPHFSEMADKITNEKQDKLRDAINKLRR